jgi:uncharacterized membrane protein YbhN (UPF0104 family)
VITFKIQNFFKFFRWLVLALCIIGIYGILPQLKEYHSVPSLLAHAKVIYIGLAIVSSLLSVIFAAITYCVLSPIRLAFIRTIIVEFASGFFNRIVPAGLGGIGLNYLYFRKSRMNKTQSFGVLALNNGLGTVGHLLLLCGFILFDPSLFHGFRLHPHYSKPYSIICVVVLILFALAVYFRSRLQRFFIALVAGIVQLAKFYRHNGAKLILGLLSSVLLTSSYLFTLYFASRALNLDIPLATLFLSLSFGVLLGSSSLSPGGIGTTEIGLVSVLIGFGVRSSDALAVALLYRLISFWMTFLLGAIAELFVKKRAYV